MSAQLDALRSAGRECVHGASHGVLGTLEKFGLVTREFMATLHCRGCFGSDDRMTTAEVDPAEAKITDDNERVFS